MGGADLAPKCGVAFAQSPATAGEAGTRAPPQASIRLARVIMALPAGANWLRFFSNFDYTRCSDRLVVSKNWPGGHEAQGLAPFASAFKDELEKAGYKVITPGQDNVFDGETSTADYEAAAVITDANFHGCINDVRKDEGGVKGEGHLTIDWQIYSPIRKQIVTNVSTSGEAKLTAWTQGGQQILVMTSFAANADQLASNADFHAVLSAPRPAAKDVLLADPQSKIVLAGNLKAPKRKISDAVGSVVTLLTGAGSGSGVLVSNDGYILTNAHVVGDDKQVRVRWSDGLETVAEVVRVAKVRDVAIIKTSSRDRTPLALKRGAVSPGQRVYAIGSPRGKDFQGTVSSGVVSASRIFDGFNFIQSDVSVSPGSSGGALLDESGSLIGITVSGVDNGGRAGLNLFIPIGDVMDFLSLEQH